eukprot:1899018-Pleurochrysis_carterae.AAC.1
MPSARVAAGAAPEGEPPRAVGAVGGLSCRPERRGESREGRAGARFGPPAVGPRRARGSVRVGR